MKISKLIIIIGWILCFSGSREVLAITLNEFKGLSFEGQRRALQEIGCYETRVGDLKALVDIVDYLNQKYDPQKVDYKRFSKEELNLLFELAIANGCAGYHTGDKRFHLVGCEIAGKLVELVGPEEAWELGYPCYYGLSSYTPEERQRIIEISANSMKKLTERAKMLNHPRKNFYKFMYGDFLCKAPGLDCPRGLSIMYEAALDEYVEKGVEGFDEGIINSIGEFYMAAMNQKNPKAYNFAAELEIALYDAGRLQMSGVEYLRQYQKVLSRWASEGITEAVHVKSLDELVRERRGFREETAPVTATSPSPQTSPAPVTLSIPSPVSVPEREPESPGGTSFFDILKPFFILSLIFIVVIILVVVVVMSLRKK
jgi:hypothetical protein